MIVFNVKKLKEKRIDKSRQKHTINDTDLKNHPIVAVNRDNDTKGTHLFLF